MVGWAEYLAFVAKRQISLDAIIYCQANLKQFMEAVRTSNEEKMTRMLNKGLDPNFHDSDTGGQLQGKH